ncbi:MAG: S8 family peptidase [Paraclostridium sp.]|uniref:S8 family peptidase n=1 Tax=Paraclostridium sp. TaxID=2023273 RepID=UPI003F3F0AA9
MYKMKLLPYKVNEVSRESKVSSYGAKMIKADKLWPKSSGGKGVTVAIIDTGCDVNHSALKDNIFHTRNFTKDNNSNKDLVNDYVGHGTHVAGIVLSVAPSCNLMILKALDRNGEGEYKWIINALNYAINQKVDVVSMSLGGYLDDENLHKSIRKAVNNNILVVCAAGNDGDNSGSTNEFSYPASYSEVISVGAVDDKAKPAYFSNSNNLVDVMAPGVGILSTFKDNSYAVLDGTSMAAPHVSGALALIKNYSSTEFKRSLSEPEIYAQLIKFTIDLNYDRNMQGNGLVFLERPKLPKKGFK